MRRRRGGFEPTVHWVNVVDVHATYDELQARGARITDPLPKKPWRLTQFTVEDANGHVFHFHGD